MKFKLLIGLFLFFLVPLALAEPTTVSVGAYVLNVGKFEVSTGTYTVDFYLSMKCDSPCNPENFEFSNGRAIAVDKLIDEPTEKFFRIQAALAENINLENYPFDEHSLTISLEDKKNTVEKLVYAADAQNAGIDPAVILVGWELKGFDQTVQTHYYEPYNETYSRYLYSIQIKRISLASVLKTFLPILFIVIVGLLVLFIHETDKLWTRIGINTSSLIASVMFHLNVTASLPPLGYLTFADKFMIITYVILIFSLGSTVLMMRHAKKKDEKMLEKIYYWSLYGVPALTLIAYSLLFLS